MTLELRGVESRYSVDGELVGGISAVDLTVGAGEIVAVRGPNGSGKSTLLRVASGLLQPQRGSVVFGGTDLARLTADQAADFRLSQVGLVLHPYRLTPGHPVVENAGMKLILKGVPIEQARQEGRRWLRRVQLEHKATKRSSQLSAGERQRVALVAALADGPRLVVADEPTAHLDRERAPKVWELLREQAESHGAAVLVATHDFVTEGVFDQILTLEDGQLVEPAHQKAAAATSLTAES